MARSRGRSQRCSPQDARKRCKHAIKFLEVAEIAAGEHEQDPEYASVAVSLAVLAGIAAADAACCAALGERSRSQDHHDAEQFLRRVRGGGEAAKQLHGLLSFKDEAQYGFFDVGPGELRKALRGARALVAFGEGALRR
ncbi:MAG: hypothetical protein WDZ46_08010 [Solirubrobacterales bacterium]